MWSFPLSVLLGVCASAWGWGSGSVQPKIAALFWTLASIVAVWMAWTDSHQLSAALNLLRSRSRMTITVRGKSLTLSQFVGTVTVATLVGLGIVLQLSVGRDNLTFDLTKQRSYPDIEAAKWIHDHTASTAVVMARQFHIVYHYTRRKVVWFPPLS